MDRRVCRPKTGLPRAFPIRRVSAVASGCSCPANRVLTPTTPTSQPRSQGADPGGAGNVRAGGRGRRRVSVHALKGTRVHDHMTTEFQAMTRMVSANLPLRSAGAHNGRP